MSTLTDQAACNPESGAVSARRRLIQKWTGWSLVAAGFAIPLSTTLSGILGAFLVLLWIADGDYRTKLQIIRHNPVALASLVLFGLYILGLFYGKPSERVVFDVSHFLLLALTIPLFGNTHVRNYALWGFLSAMLFMLTLSYLAWLNLIPQIAFLDVHPGNPLVVQDKITYGFFMTLGALFLVIESHFSERGLAWRVVMALLAVLAVFNLLFMVNNKTAYLVLLVLGGYFLISRWRWKGATAFF